MKLFFLPKINIKPRFSFLTRFNVGLRTSSCFALCFSSLTSLSVQATTLIPIDTSGVFNADVIVDHHGGLDTTQTSIDAGGEGGNYCFFTQAASVHLPTAKGANNPSNPIGLPNNGTFSQTDEHPNIVLGYGNSSDGNKSENNALQMRANDLEQSFEVPPDHYYSAIHLFFTSGDNQSGESVEFIPSFHYKDGTVEQGSYFVVPDWDVSIPPLPEQNYYLLTESVGRVKPDGSQYDESGSHFAIFGYKIPVNSTKILQRVSIGVNIYGPSVLNFFGAAGEVEPSSSPPTARNVQITGTTQVGETLSGEYTYSDNENDPEGESRFQWYRAMGSDCTMKTAIEGATQRYYTVTHEDEGRCLCFGVIPVSQTDTEKTDEGTEVIVMTADVVTDSSLPILPTPSGSPISSFPTSSPSTIKFDGHISPILLEKYTLFIQTDGNGQGYVKSDTGLLCHTQDCIADPRAVTGRSCQANCSQQIKTLNLVTLTPVAEKGSFFSSWGGHPECTTGQLTMDDNELCIAYFRKIQTHLSINVKGPGQIAVDVGKLNWKTSQQARSVYDYGTRVMLTAIPSDQAYFYRWEGSEDCLDGQVNMESDQACTAIFLVNTPPEAKIVATTPIEVNQEINFIGRVSDREPTDMHTFIWDFGDGQTDQTQNPSHRYTQVGRYLVTFTVTDQRGGSGHDQMILEIVTPQPKDIPEVPPLQKEEPQVVQPPEVEPSPVEVPLDPPVEGPVAVDVPVEKNLTPSPVLPPTSSDHCQLDLGLIWEVCHAGGQRITVTTRITSTGVLSKAILDAPINNQGWVSNLTITEKGILSGGVVTGYIVNEGLMKDFEFKGRSLIGGRLGGELINNSPVEGYFQDITLEAHAHLQGGILTGTITGDPQAPALLERVTIKAGSHLKGVKLGQGVKLEDQVTLEENDLACRFWGVHDAGRNDSQLLTLDYSAEHFDIKPFGPLHPGLDLESLDISPKTGELYAASGDDSQLPGHLYHVNKENGDVTDLGSLGVKGVEALAFHPDGTLWGYAQDKGLFKVTQVPDLSTFTVVLPPVKTIRVGDITWDINGHWLYGVQNSSKPGSGQGALLWAYHLDEGISKTLCPDLMIKKVEMMETLPDGSLVIGFQEGQLSKFSRIDLTTCQIVAEKKTKTPYHDIEGLTWEGCR